MPLAPDTTGARTPPSTEPPATPPAAASATTDRASGRAPLGVALVVGLVALLAACGTSGRELREVPAGETAPPRTEQPGGGPTSLTDSTDTTAAATDGIVLSGVEFLGGEALPATATCDGEGLSPALSWSGVPEGTAELALVVTDPDAEGTTVLWAVTDIAPDSTGTDAGAVPEGATVHPGADGSAAWSPPCPPEGATHTIELALYASAEGLDLAGTTGADEVSAELRTAAGEGRADLAVLTASVSR